VAETNIKITADTRQAEKQIDALGRSLENLQTSSADMAKALGAITAAAAAMGYAILQTLDSAGQLIDAAKSLGVSAVNLNQLHQAALLAGVGADTLNASLQRLNANIGEGLQKGTGPAVDALKRLNIPIRELAAQRPDQQFQTITQRLSEIESPAQRAAAAMDLFGKQGPAVLRVAEELAKVKELTENLGLGITQRDLSALDEAGDALTELKIIWDAGIKKAVAEVAPYIVAIVNKIKEGIKDAGGFEGIWTKIKSVLNTALNIMLGIATVLAVRMVAGAAAFAVQLGRALIAARGISLVLSRTPIGLISAGIALAADALGIDLVGAGKEFLDLNLDIDQANKQINESAAKTTQELEKQIVVSKELTDEQKKALETLDATILKLQQQADYSKSLLLLGEEEAKIQKTIAEERAKLEKVGLTLSTQQEGRIRQLIQEEELMKRISDTTKKADEALKSMMSPQSVKRIEAWTELQKAQEQFIQALSTGDTKLIEKTKSNVEKLDMAYQNLIIRYAKGLSEREKLDLDYFDKKSALDEALYGLNVLRIDQESELYKNLIDEKLRLDQDYEQKKQDLALASIERRLMAEKSAMAAVLSEQDRAVLQAAGQQERQKAIVQERIAFEKKSEIEKAQFAIQQGAEIFNALGAQNKRAFEAAKAFNIANAIMNTYMAATKALATYPWPFGMIAAAAAVASGLAQVAQIRSQSYSGRALGGPVMGGQSYIVGENGPELFTPATTGSITRNSDLQGGKNVTVNFQIVANDTTGFDQLLASRKGLITQIINDAVLEKGRRSIA
jgi:hypothetical protein